MDRTLNCLETSVEFQQRLVVATSAASCLRGRHRAADAASPGMQAGGQCPGVASRSAGSCARQSSSANRQRGANRQARPRPMSFGGAPGMVRRLAARSCSSVGMDSKSASV